MALGIVCLSLAAWVALVWLVLNMGHPLARLSMPMSAEWSAANVAGVGAMWAVMMAAMMLPSALPMLLGFSALNRAHHQTARSAAFVAAYLLTWIAFSVAATALQWCLQSLAMIDPMAASESPALNVVLILIAGIYQFTPLKRVCLVNCRTPTTFLLMEWRDGLSGAFRMGWRHGTFCLGCCWALMALLFVGGAMNLAWVAALSLAVAVEKLIPRGERIAQVLGLVLIAVGLFRLGEIII